MGGPADSPSSPSDIVLLSARSDGGPRVFLPLSVRNGIAAGQLLSAVHTLRRPTVHSTRSSGVRLASSGRILTVRDSVPAGTVHLLAPGDRSPFADRAADSPTPRIGARSAAKSRHASVSAVREQADEPRMLRQVLRAASQAARTRRLDLSNCESGDFGMKSVVQWMRLRHNHEHVSFLTAIDVSGNALGVKGMRLLADALPAGVEEVDVRQNRAEGWAAGVASIAAALRNQRYQGSVRVGAIDDADAIELARALRKIVVQQRGSDLSPVVVHVNAKRVPLVWRHKTSGAAHEDPTDLSGAAEMVQGVLSWRGLAELHDDALAVADVAVQVSRSSSITVPPVPETGVDELAMPEAARVDCRRVSRLNSAGHERLSKFLSGAATLRRVEFEWAHTAEVQSIAAAVGAALSNPLITQLWFRGLAAASAVLSAQPSCALHAAAARVVEISEPNRRTPPTADELLPVLQLPQLSALLITTPAAAADVEAAACDWAHVIPLVSPATPVALAAGTARRELCIALRCSRRSDLVVTLQAGVIDLQHKERAQALWSELQQASSDLDHSAAPSISPDQASSVVTCWESVAESFGRVAGAGEKVPSMPGQSGAGDVDTSDVAHLLRAYGVREEVVRKFRDEAVDGVAFRVLGSADAALAQLGISDEEDRARVLMCHRAYLSMLRRFSLTQDGLSSVLEDTETGSTTVPSRQVSASDCGGGGSGGGSGGGGGVAEG
eukprot:TRINITY_DN6681_c3_g1_i1.p1 TRINITY_DN6681_c3_g1~~TRINITY_DN6681_c3_g1_i1.p1  ORF type:complete len:746 (+),score=259.11 TRINITY_DN6681_c3_g1_i1:64-2238(+)